MKVLEFHFNPDNKDKVIFDSFCYTPENIYEKRMGGIYMLGELKNPLPHNYRLLEKTAVVVKKEFYLKFHRAHEQALKESLKRGNEILSAEVARENTDWLGNLNFAIISLKNFELNFTKVGAIKMFLIRNSRVIDIGSKLDSQEIEPYPLKIFNNIVSGKVRENDIILMFSEKTFLVLKNIINEIANLPAGRQGIASFDEKRLKDLIKTKEKELAEISGALILINVAKASTASRSQKIIFKKEAEKFRITQAFLPISEYSKKATAFFKNIPGLAASLLKRKKKEPVFEPAAAPIAPVKIKVKVEESKPKSGAFKLPWLTAGKISFKIPSIKLKLPVLRLPVLRMPVLKMPVIKIPSLKKFVLKKKLVPILLLIFALATGYLIFRNQEKQNQKEYLATLQIIQEKVSQAETLMILKDANPEAKKQALFLLSSAWDEVLPIIKLNGAAKFEALSLKERISDDLKNLNNLVKIDEPDLFFEISKQDFIPQKIIYDEKNLYFFSPYAQNIYKLDENKNSRLFEENQKFDKACLRNLDSVLFFSKPDKLALMENGEMREKITLQIPHPDWNPAGFTMFKESAYFLDAKNAKIIKYFPPFTDNEDNPQIWLAADTQNILDAKSIAVDGSVWILNKDNNLLRYYGGNLQETVNPDVFPAPKSFSKILIPFGSPYIFILEPTQKRVLIFDKQGKIVTQFESEKFDNLLDFTVSQDLKTIWLLNGQKVYKINI